MYVQIDEVCDDLYDFTISHQNGIGNIHTKLAEIGIEMPESNLDATDIN